MLTIALLTLGDPDTPSGGYLYHRRMAELAGEHGARIQFVSVPARRLATLAVPTLLKHAESFADVMVLDSIAVSRVAPWLLWRMVTMPMTAMLHQPPGGVDGGRLAPLQRRLDLFAYRKLGLLLLASESLVPGLSADVPAARLVVAPPGCDPSFLAETFPAEDLRRGRAASVLCAGNWLEHKGIDSLLKAVAALPDPSVTVHLAGETCPESAYGRRVRAIIDRPDMRDRIVAHGSVSACRIAQLYASADIFVLLGDRETYGTVYGEAMFAGLPIIGWEAGNLPNLLTQGCEGFMAQPGDISAVSRYLELLAADAELREKLGKAARSRALSLPTWSQSAKLFFTAIRSIAVRQE